MVKEVCEESYGQRATRLVEVGAPASEAYAVKWSLYSAVGFVCIAPTKCRPLFLHSQNQFTIQAGWQLHQDLYGFCVGLAAQDQA